jgi:hypothetical protein
MAMKPHPVARAPMTRNPDRTRIGRGPLHVNHVFWFGGNVLFGLES